MDLYLGAPFSHIHATSPGYALAHEMTGNTFIEKYKALQKLILDNGADELGEGQSGMRLAYLAGRLQPNFLILPDVLHKDKLTRQKGEKFYEQMQGSGYNGKYIGVIQAKSLEKGLKSYEWWAKSGMVDRIGITYDTKIPNTSYREFEWGGRLNFLTKLRDSKIYNKYPIGLHLLGTLDVHELYVLNYYPEFSTIINDMVASHDTTMPYACDTAFYAGEGAILLDRPKDYPRQNFKSTLEGERLEIALWNVAAYLTACKIDPKMWSQYLGDRAVRLFSYFESYYESF
jgi:hypothetical protein